MSGLHVLGFFLCCASGAGMGYLTSRTPNVIDFLIGLGVLACMAFGTGCMFM